MRLIFADSAQFAAQIAELAPGAYALIFRMRRETVQQTGWLREIVYPAGWYAYIGSARKGISGRIRHHLNIPHKRPHWHIDHLLPHGNLDTIIAIETDQSIECFLAEHLAQTFSVIPKFGSSDCRCKSHLFYAQAKDALVDAAVAGDKIGKFKAE